MEENKMDQLPRVLFETITEFAWDCKVDRDTILFQLDCCIDCRGQIPEWFKNMTTTKLTYYIGCGESCNILTRVQNPLVNGHPFVPISKKDLHYDTNVHLLLKHIDPAFFSRRCIYKASVWKLLTRDITESWNRLITKLDGLSITDVSCNNYLVRALLYSMVLSLSSNAGLICRWRLNL